MTSIGNVGGLQPSEAQAAAELAPNGPFAGNAALEAIASGQTSMVDGARGDHVRHVQATLMELGYELPRWGADGWYGGESATAIRAFQRDQGLPQTGVVDAETLVRLDRAAVGGAEEQPGGPPASGGLRPDGPLGGDPVLQEVAAGQATLASGSRGEPARLLQQALMDAGYELPRWGADGWLGDESSAAVRALQGDLGLPQTGVVDAATLIGLDGKLAGGSGAVEGPSGVTPGTTYPGSEAPGIQNPRFDHAALHRVSSGGAALRPGASGPEVEAVQRALLDIGIPQPRWGADGIFGDEMTRAVWRFQIEAGLPRTGVVDQATIEALDRMAPPPGQALERYPDYAAIFEDGRADMTIGIGFDEHGTTPGTTQKILRGLTDQGFRRIDPQALAPDERERLGLGPDRFIEGPRYYHRVGTDPDTGDEVDYVVRVITPDSGDGPADAAAMFRHAMEVDEIVVYNGHARYGTGPDFGPIGSGEGKVVINEAGNSRGSRPPAHLASAIEGRGSDLPEIGNPDKYQLLFIQACGTEEYLPNLRDMWPGRSTDDTDIVATTMPTRLASGADHVNTFVDGILGRSSIDDINERNNQNEIRWLEYFGAERFERELEEARGAMMDNGFLGNPGNRLIDSPHG